MAAQFDLFVVSSAETPCQPKPEWIEADHAYSKSGGGNPAGGIGLFTGPPAWEQAGRTAPTIAGVTRTEGDRFT
jgi:hypothetical protein